MRMSLLLAVCGVLLSGCAVTEAFRGYPNPDAVLGNKCFMPGNAVVSIDGRTCVGLGYPPIGYGFFVIR
jgi:hypothetical protein